METAVRRRQSLSSRLHAGGNRGFRSGWKDADRSLRVNGSQAAAEPVFVV